MDWECQGCHNLKPSNRPVRTRMPGGVAGAAAMTAAPLCRFRSVVRPHQAYPVQSDPMFAARLFPLNPAASTTVAAGVRAISTKTTTIKG